jgi:hypothetical protein
MKLRQQYPELNIPKYPKTENKEALNKILTIWKERIRVKENRQKNLKGYLYMVIFGIQFFFTKFLKFDNLSGFFEDHMFFIEKYETLISKVSEKYNTVNNVISILEPEKTTKIEVLEKNPEIKLVFYLMFYSIVIIILRQFFRQNSFDNMLKNKILNAISGKESITDSIGSNLLNIFSDSKKDGQLFEKRAVKKEGNVNHVNFTYKTTQSIPSADITKKPRFEE